MARRILLTIEYDGTAYSGWQRQYNGLAVQQLIEEALTRATSETITITGASRTDAGVHALGQCAHFDTSSRIPPEKYPFVLNTMLPRDIRVQAGREVPDGFHARFMTCGKRYTYRILNSRHGSAIQPPAARITHRVPGPGAEEGEQVPQQPDPDPGGPKSGAALLGVVLGHGGGE